MSWEADKRCQCREGQLFVPAHWVLFELVQSPARHHKLQHVTVGAYMWNKNRKKGSSYYSYNTKRMIIGAGPTEESKNSRNGPRGHSLIPQRPQPAEL
jgi:hypothetical protein